MRCSVGRSLDFMSVAQTTPSRLAMPPTCGGTELETMSTAGRFGMSRPRAGSGTRRIEAGIITQRGGHVI